MFEDVPHVLELGTAAPTRTVHSRMHEPVIPRPLIGIAQDVIGSCGFFELLDGLLITGIAVGMVLERELLVSLLDFLR